MTYKSSSLFFLVVALAQLNDLVNSVASTGTSSSSLDSVKVSYDPTARPWAHLSYDPDNFVCERFEPLCTNFLDQIGCVPAARKMWGCQPDLYHFNGTCICNGNPVYQDKGARISKQIIDNRIKADIGWMLEPWNIGPPFSVEASYPPICELLLERLGCPPGEETIAIGSSDGKTPFTCKCGKFSASVRTEELICDKINEASLMEMPIFDEPVTMSVEFSIALVLIVGKLGAIIASLIYLPPIIGFLLGGVAIQDIVSQSLIKGAGGNGPHATPFSEIRIFALIIVLMRAGMTLKPQDIAKKGFMTVALATLPYFAEFAVILGIGMKLLGWSVIDMGLLASILAALSPSLVIPGMIKYVHEKLGYTPKTVLTSAPIEVVLAIILFNIFTSLERTTPDPILPWVKVLPLWANIILIPVNIAFSCALGYFTGYSIVRYIHYRTETKNKTVERTLGNNTAEFLFISIVACYALYSLCTPQYIQQSSGVLAVFSMTLTMSHYGAHNVIEELKTALAGLWVFVEVFLFTTTGINLAFKGTTGPLQSNRGINASDISKLLEILFIGTMGRSAGIFTVQLLGYGTLKPHRREPRYMAAWWISTWMFQWPKATVQATLGGLPLAYHIIPGAVGLTKGLFIQQASAFAVLLMATIGVFLTAVVGRPLAEYLAARDKEAGYDENDVHISEQTTPAGDKALPQGTKDAGDLEMMSVAPTAVDSGAPIDEQCIDYTEADEDAVNHTPNHHNGYAPLTTTTGTSLPYDETATDAELTEL